MSKNHPFPFLFRVVQRMIHLKIALFHFVQTSAENDTSDGAPAKNYVLYADSEDEMQEWIKALNDEIKPMIGEDRYANGFSGGKTAGSSSNSSAGSSSSSKGKAKKGKGGGGERGVDDKALDQVSWYTLRVCVCVCVCVPVCVC